MKNDMFTSRSYWQILVCKKVLMVAWSRQQTWVLINIVHQWPFPCCVWILEFSSLVINQQQAYLTHTFDQSAGLLPGIFVTKDIKMRYCILYHQKCYVIKSLFTTTEANYSIKVCRWGIKVCLTGSEAEGQGPLSNNVIHHLATCLTPVMVLITVLHHFSTISGGTQDLNWFHFGQKSHEAYLSKILTNLHSFTVWH